MCGSGLQLFIVLMYFFIKMVSVICQEYILMKKSGTEVTNKINNNMHTCESNSLKSGGLHGQRKSIGFKRA